ncbi:Crp/Fnr family transcriptional regulator [Aminobacter sp. HY435]|uniref:Crp/Fnr family transcriptional regulator n=1 Tax=Aminobacter sp. HY435 TaxID=2970917 RepID=UPI0022B94EEB|nr:Crp/Fnr family transcriptional regulator [Aminobacter sp. HY435]
MTELTLFQFFQKPPLGLHFNLDYIRSDFFDSIPKIYEPGAIVSRQGDSNTRVFIVASGWSCISRHLSDGSRQIIDTPLKGDMLGFPSFDSGGINALVAVSEVALYEIPGQTFRSVVDQNAALGAVFSRIAARQHAVTVERLTSVCRRSAIERTAHYLLELGERVESSTTPIHGYECPLTQHDLADVLGLTQIHVNRTLRELRERDLVSFRAGAVEFLNRSKLVKLAGFDKTYLQYNWPTALRKGAGPRQSQPAMRPADR